jgi:hypothetical protein
VQYEEVDNTSFGIAAATGGAIIPSVKELPLHPDDVYSSSLVIGKNGEIEFEIVEIDKCVGICMKMAHDYSDNAECCLSGCEDTKKVAKLISIQEELPNDNKLYKEIDNKDGSITLVPKNPDFGKIFPFGKQEESET